MPDFIDVMTPILKVGPWTNYKALNQNKDPNVLASNKGDPTFGTKRGNKNGFIGVKNLPAPAPQQDLNGRIIFSTLIGEISCVHTDNDSRNAMKADVINLLVASGKTFKHLGGNDTPKNRNKETSTITVQILQC